MGSERRALFWAVVTPIVTISVLTIAVLASVGTFSADPPLPPEPVPDPCPRDAALSAVPPPNRFTSVAAPFAGPGPHPVVVIPVVKAQDGTWLPGDDDLGAGSSLVPPEWEVPFPPDKNLDKIQLVACEYHISIGPIVDWCRYTNNSAYALRSTTYSYRVYAARTADLVTTFELTGGSGCPAEITATEASRAPVPEFTQQPTTLDFQNAMRTTVENPK